MSILTLSGSSRVNSSNSNFLLALNKFFTEASFVHFDKLQQLPLFDPNIPTTSHPESVIQWRRLIDNIDSIIICTPEYLHNCPALIKNALEWTAQTGEFDNKHVLPITYTPLLPRGEKAMRSLIWSLKALNANIVTSLTLDKTMINVNNNLTFSGDPEVLQMLTESLKMLKEVSSLTP